MNHKNLSFICNIPKHLDGTYKNYVIKNIHISKLRAKLVISNKNNIIKHDLFDIEDTPHYKFVSGAKEFYKNYLDFGWSVGLEHTVENFEKLLLSFKNYLDDNNKNNYIICQKENDNFVIRDGLHRASILLYNNHEYIPVAILDQEESQLETYFYDYKDTFEEWYTPVEINQKLIINERTYPNFIERPEYMNNRERGKSKWEYIIEKNLPDLRGKRVCDVGCSVGLFDYLMIKKGAELVDGYDRSEQIVQPTNTNLSRQSVVQQAYFIKNLFELKDKTKYNNLNFFEYDINQADFTKFNYDVFFSTCVLYHFGEKFEKFVKDISTNHKFVFLQTNLGHNAELGKFASVEYHKYLLEKYGYSVTVDSPENYKYPVIIGKINE